MLLFFRWEQGCESCILLCCKHLIPLRWAAYANWLTWAGPSRRFFWRRLRGCRPTRQDYPRWSKGTAGRLRLHSWRDGRIQILFQQPDEYFCWEICWFRDRRTLLLWSLLLPTVWLLTGIRLRTNNAPRYHQSKAHHRNKRPRWRSLSSSSQASSRLSPGTKSIFGQERTGISAQSEAQKGGFSTSVLSRVWWWCAWLDYRFSLSDSSSRVQGRATCERNLGGTLGLLALEELNLWVYF